MVRLVNITLSQAAAAALILTHFTTSANAAQQDPGWEYDRDANSELLPEVPEGFEITFFAREPLVRQPGAMAFDARGRLTVGMGPQYRSPKPDTPGDSVVFVLDTDGDGEADETKTFATGFNCIQGLAWRGDELWIANAPDLTVVRDLDGDDVADEYVRLYTDLGNLEHGLHGLTWSPDGRLYMSKGNSKGLTQPGRYAPKAFRDLWGMNAPDGTPDFPEPVRFNAENYEKNYHSPKDDWGREGGVLRCDADGSNLEIISRGARNPWDIAMDDGFNWLGTDNDQSKGDSIFMPFPGAHFGWNHMWSSHWGTELHAPTAPVSGPLFEGSGTGIIFGNASTFPQSHRAVFFINDWLNKTTYVWRPRWDGALLRAENGLEPFIVGGKSLFRPTDIEVGPDGALWILGWGSGYGAEYKDGKIVSEGRVFRVTYKGQTETDKNHARRSQALSDWPTENLVSELQSHLPVRRINAQNELVRRGASVLPQIVSRLNNGVSDRLETWLIWTMARIELSDATIDQRLTTQFADSVDRSNARVQSLRALAFRNTQTGRHSAINPAKAALKDTNARLRFEGVQVVRESASPNALHVLLDILAREKDPTVYYSGWQTLRHLSSQNEQRTLLEDNRPSIRRAALLALLEDNALELPTIAKLAEDKSPLVSEIAKLRLTKGAEGERVMVKGRPLNSQTALATSNPQNSRSANAFFPAISDVRAKNGEDYRIARNLRPGANPYTDRNYGIEKVPESLLGATFIQTQNSDDKVAGNDWLSFTAHRPVRVIMAIDHRLITPPKWVRDRFTPMNDVIHADHWLFRLHEAEFPAGRVTLGGNTDDGQSGGKGMYIAVVQPLPIAPPTIATTTDAVTKMVKEGNSDSGRWLFHSDNGVGCFQCHQLEGHGNAFGPDLSALTTRSTVEHVVQSILEPNAVITEGYNQLSIDTEDESFSGILVEESGLSVSLGLADGTRRTIPKSHIKSRSTSQGSAMPAYDTVLSSSDVADLTAYLMMAAAPPETAKSVSSGSFDFEMRDDRMLLKHKEQLLAEYVFVDSEIRRPHFANVHAPSGAKVTRNHPPIEGVDATDHATMHPGLWLAFGDLNGNDFWRNKATVKHIRFVEGPIAENDTLTFAVENHWIGADGSLVCRETARYSFAEQDFDGDVTGTTLIWDSTMHSDDHDLKFGHQEEMGLGIRVASDLTVKTGQGMILNSRGQRDGKQVWGNTADWWHYGGKLNDQFAGILIVPDKKLTPMSWGHARDYGALVINPTKPPRANGTFIGVKPGAPFRLRYGVFIYSAPKSFSLDQSVRAMNDLINY